MCRPTTKISSIFYSKCRFAIAFSKNNRKNSPNFYFSQKIIAKIAHFLLFFEK